MLVSLFFLFLFLMALGATVAVFLCHVVLCRVYHRTFRRRSEKKKEKKKQANKQTHKRTKKRTEKHHEREEREGWEGEIRNYHNGTSRVAQYVRTYVRIFRGRAFLWQVIYSYAGFADPCASRCRDWYCCWCCLSRKQSNATCNTPRDQIKPITNSGVFDQEADSDRLGVAHPPIVYQGSNIGSGGLKTGPGRRSEGTRVQAAHSCTSL